MELTPPYPAVCRGGDVINFAAKLTALAQLREFAFFLTYHPVFLANYTINFADGSPVNFRREHSHQYDGTPLLGVLDVQRGIELFVAMTFVVQPFVLPNADLFFCTSNVLLCPITRGHQFSGGTGFL